MQKSRLSISAIALILVMVADVMPQVPSQQPVRKEAPVTGSLMLSLIATADASSIPRPDPLLMALKMIASDRKDLSPEWRRGGLWITGDNREAVARLRWIVGKENAGCLKVDEQGRVELGLACLSSLAGLNRANSAAAPLIIADYIHSNEGLLLLVQLSRGNHRYQLHIGDEAPTWGGKVPVTGAVNLDNKYDSRINPKRPLRRKAAQERPPEGIDSLIVLNPAARWINLTTGFQVPAGHITFHELAEAYARVELGLDYLAKGGRPGAHLFALEREMRLKMQRPDSDVVVTVGSNRLLKSEVEVRRFFVKSGITMNADESNGKDKR